MNLEPRSNSPALPRNELPFTPTTEVAKVALGLALLTFLIFLPSVEHTFVNYDDDVFVTNNPKVAPGLTWEGIKWAFTTTEIDFWRPLSWLSHMLDMELFGPLGGGHHLTSILIHIAATLMLFFALHRLAGELWPSAVVAALFAWHPLHVESVAWIAERKDVLCGFFWFLTLWAYARYVERPCNERYALILVGFAFGSMSKPMIVTLPCVLLLLDYWPLRRIELSALAIWQEKDRRVKLALWWRLFSEKIPMFAAVVALSLSTAIAQKEVGTESTELIPWSIRVSNSLLSYKAYLSQTFWPSNMSVLYPYRKAVPLLGALGAFGLCGGATLLCLLRLRQQPYLIVGWLWFLGVLVPVIGLFKVVGEQSHADRYTYVPLVGLFIGLVWGVREVARCNRHGIRALPWLSGSILLVCAIGTRLQLRHWEDSVTLFKRAIEVNPQTVTAYANLGAQLIMNGRNEEALTYLERGLALERATGILGNLVFCHIRLGQFERARVPAYELASRWPSDRITLHLLREFRAGSVDDPIVLDQRKILALMLATRGEHAAAANVLAEVLAKTPLDIDSRIDRAAYLAVSKQESEALTLLEETVRLMPSHPIALSNLGSLLAKRGQTQEALTLYQRSLKLSPENVDTRHNYALALLRLGKPLEARAEFESVLKRKTDHLATLQQLAWLLATHPACLEPKSAMKLANSAMAVHKSSQTLDVAAAALAANQDFQASLELISQAIELARRFKLTEHEKALRGRALLYQDRQSFIQAPSSTNTYQGL
jgi:tetratricopeptide (TPR) repeat protein